MAQTMHRGDIVCNAVEAYRAKTGKYPFQLADLQPDFLRIFHSPQLERKIGVIPLSTMAPTTGSMSSGLSGVPSLAEWPMENGNT